MDPDLLHSASFVDDETFVVEHEDELHLALEACHWKTKKLENVVVQDGDILLVVVAEEGAGCAPNGRCWAPTLFVPDAAKKPSTNHSMLSPGGVNL